jgi:hypothetical protein
MNDKRRLMWLENASLPKQGINPYAFVEAIDRF